LAVYHAWSRPNQYSGIQALGFTDTYCLRQP
jgi:hypothetical protein